MLGAWLLVCSDACSLAHLLACHSRDAFFSTSAPLLVQHRALQPRCACGREAASRRNLATKIPGGEGAAGWNTVSVLGPLYTHPSLVSISHRERASTSGLYQGARGLFQRRRPGSSLAPRAPGGTRRRTVQRGSMVREFLYGKGFPSIVRDFLL